MTQFLRRLPLPVLLVCAMLLGAALTGTAMAQMQSSAPANNMQMYRGHQGHMHNAQRALERAKDQLQAAIPDKAGHREQALSLVTQAMEQVRLGIQAGAK
jgi:hypothetical protein